MTVTRGASNSNQRGSSYQRRDRKNYLLETYAADQPFVRVEWPDGRVQISTEKAEVWQRLVDYFPSQGITFEVTPTTRCFRCGDRLHYDILTVDRIVPYCLGGTYARTNIRPACLDCNTETGSALANANILMKKKARVSALRRSCPTCLAQPTQRCMTKALTPTNQLHAARLRKEPQE